MQFLSLFAPLLIAFSSFQGVASTFDTTDCTDCVDRDCVYCGVAALWNQPTNSSLCRCGNFTGTFGDCSDYSFFAEEYETTQQCIDDTPADWSGLDGAIEASIKAYRRFVIIMIVLGCLAGVAGVAAIVYCCVCRKRKIRRQQEGEAVETPFAKTAAAPAQAPLVAVDAKTSEDSLVPGKIA